MRRIAGALALALALAACRDEPAAAPERAAGAPPQPAAAAAPPLDMAETEVRKTIPVGGPELLVAVNVGSPAAGPGELKTVKAGAPIRARLETQPLPAGYVARMLLRKGERVVEASTGAAEGARTIEVAIETADLEPGEWALEVWLGGEKVDARTISIARP